MDGPTFPIIVVACPWNQLELQKHSLWSTTMTIIGQHVFQFNIHTANTKLKKLMCDDAKMLNKILR